MYLVAHIDVKYGRLGQFNEVMASVVPMLEERGWRLAAAYSSIVGRIGRVIDVFEIPDANAVPSVLHAVRAEPEFAALAEQLAELIHEETTMLALKAPYGP